MALAVGNAVAHQIYVALCWRLELHASRLSRVFGHAAFPTYAIGFTLLIVARPALITLPALSNAGTVPIDPPIALALAAVLAIPVVWLAVSIHRFFGFAGAFGIDHFDASCRPQPIVRQGIFRLT